MGPPEQTLTPVAVAVHTRDREEDYRWYPEVGPALLVDQLKGLHRELIADQDAKPAATFVLLDQGERIGLLVANLKTERTDHYRTRIDDTLILEFTAKDRNVVYRLAARLLGTDSGDALRRFLEYAEARFQPGSGAATIEPLTVPVAEGAAGAVDFAGELHLALRSNEQNQRRVSDLLHRAVVEPTAVMQPFILVSTGFVGKDKLQKHDTVGQQFIALSRSSSLPEDEDIALVQAGEKKKRDRLPAMAVAGSLLLLGFLGISLGGWALLRNKSSNSSEGNFAQNSTDSGKKLPDSGKKLPDSGKKLPDSGKKLPDDHATESRRKLARAAGLAGIGAASQGNAGLLVVTALLADDVR